MKQKLLLALFVLFASVGAMRAAGDVTLSLPIGTGNVSVSVSGGTVSPSYGGSTSKSFTIPLTASTQSIDLVGGDYTSMIVTGKVTASTVEQTAIESLTFSNNGELNSLTLTQATLLKKLDVQGNKLTKADITGKPINCVVTWGTQTLDVSTNPAPTANAGIKMTTAFSSQLFFADNSSNRYTWTKINSNGSYTSTSEAHVNGTNVDEFFFYDNNKVYTDGTYQCTITNSKESGTVVLKGIKIAPAEITLDIKGSPKSEINQPMGEIPAANIVVTSCPLGIHSGTNYHQGDILQIGAAAETNYTFDKFDQYENFGLVKTVDAQPGSSMATFKVQAKFNGVDEAIKPTIRAVFKGTERTINFEAGVTAGGSFIITDSKGIQIKNGDKVEFGKILTITATPDKNYKAEYKVNGVAGASPHTISTIFGTSNVAKVHVIDNLNITVAFAQTTDPTYKIAFVMPDGKTFADWGAVFTTVTIADQDATPGSGGEFYEVSSTSIKPNTTTYIKVVTQSADYIVSSGKVAATGSSTIQSLTFTPSETMANTFTASFVAPENGNANITITALSQKTLVVNATTTGQTYTYDGQPKEFAYTTDPSGLKLDVFYKNSLNGSSAAYTTSAPTAVGEYDVKYSRKAKDGYTAVVEKLLPKAIKIEAAAVELKTAPTVTAVKNTTTNIYNYQIGTSYSASALGKAVTGKFAIVDAGGTDITECNPQTSHNATLRFTVMDGNTPNSNYKVVTKQVEVVIGNKPLDKFNVTILPQTGVTVEIYNGATKIDGKNIPTGTNIKLVAKVSGYSKVDFQNTSISSVGDKKTATQVGTSSVFETVEFPVSSTLEYKIVLSNKLSKKYTFETKTQTFVYSGEVKAYDAATNGLTVKDANGTSLDANALAAFLKKHPIFYKDANGKVLEGAPVNAGKYSICIQTADDFVNQYAAQLFISDNSTLQINKKDPAVMWPDKASKIGKGQKLSAAIFSGGSADVTGTFTWEDGSIEPTDGERYTIVFTPGSDYTANYNVRKLTAAEQKNNTVYNGLAIIVSDKPVISIASALNGEVIVKDKNGVQYHSGNEVVKGTVLTITATPIEGCIVDNLTVNGAAFTSGSSLTVDNKSLAIVGTFKLKSADPSALKVTFTKTGKGFTVDKTDAVVKFNDNFSFTVKTAAADKDKVVVKGGATVLKANGNGTYTLSAMTKDTVISISLATPTKLKVAIEKETKNAKGYKTGKVQIQGGTADSTYYYGDVLTLTAFPETGVSFHSWSDSNTDNPRTYMVTTATTLKPSFTGTPTGIADIEGTKVYGDEGYIYVSCEGQATVTVVTMDGRSQQVRIAGEARIETGAGIYGVILQQGAEVLKTKVVVR